MINATDFMQGYYNLSKVISTDMIEDPTTWLFNFNVEMGGLFVVGSLLAFGVALFFIARNLEGVKDSEAAVASGFVLSVIGTLLFFIEVGGDKILSFDQLLLFLIITAVSIIVNIAVRKH